MNEDLRVMCSINPTGYSITAVEIAKALVKLGYNLRFDLIAGTPIYDSEEDKTLFEGLMSVNKLISVDAPCVRIWHQFALDTYIGRGLKVGFPIFELDKFTDLEKWNLKIPDHLIVCSNWAKNIVYEQTGVSAKVTPLGVDIDTFYAGEKERDEGEPFTFLNVGKWEVRKGHDILVDIFNRAFKPDDNVQLKILAPLWASTEERDDWIRLYKSSRLGDKIHFLDRVPSHKDVANIMRGVDAGIFPSRAEGWNLELLEMMACGKPVIATNYSAHTEFCNADNSFLVEPDGLEPAYDGKWFYGQGSWACLKNRQLDEFASHMRNVYENWRFNQAGVDTGKEFTWTNSAKKLLSNIDMTV